MNSGVLGRSALVLLAGGIGALAIDRALVIFDRAKSIPESAFGPSAEMPPSDVRETGLRESVDQSRLREPKGDTVGESAPSQATRQSDNPGQAPYRTAEIVVGSDVQPDSVPIQLNGAKAQPTRSSADSNPAAPAWPRSVPRCWRFRTNLADNYFTTTREEHDIVSGHSSVRISSISELAQFGSLYQTVSGATSAGQRVSFEAFLKTDRTTQGASLALIATDARRLIVAAEISALLAGSNDWQLHKIVQDIPEDAAAIRFEVRLLGEGTLWADDARLSIIDSDHTVPPPASRNLGRLPEPDIAALPDMRQNPDFELWDENCGAG